MLSLNHFVDARRKITTAHTELEIVTCIAGFITAIRTTTDADAFADGLDHRLKEISNSEDAEWRLTEYSMMLQLVQCVTSGLCHSMSVTS